MTPRPVKVPAELFAICPDCGALPCDWSESPSSETAAYAVISEAVRRYGTQGGPWNVPSDPGGWIMRAKTWLKESEGAKV